MNVISDPKVTGTVLSPEANQAAALADAKGLDSQLRAIPGVVATGLFLGMADTILIQDGDRVELRQRAVS